MSNYSNEGLRPIAIGKAIRRLSVLVTMFLIGDKRGTEVVK